MNTNNLLAAKLEKLLSWGAPQGPITTPHGTSMVREAAPTSAFWGMWRSQKSDLMNIGVCPKLLAADNRWVVRWYEDAALHKETSATPAPTAPALPSTPPATPTARVWSAEQEAIFAWFKSGKGSLVVRARAGTGKTTTIKTAFTYAPEERMLYAVFNKKNQVEAASAIADPRVEIRTLHSVGFMFIQQIWPEAKPDDEVEAERVEKVVGAQAPQQVKTQVKKLVGFAKNTLLQPTVEELVALAEERDIECPAFAEPENGGWDVTKLATSALAVLERSKQQHDRMSRISYDDMVWLPVVMGWTRAWYDLVVVDEAQDMNLPQLTMAKMAVKKGGRICVVGDDRQAIYHFRGAASDGMDMMKQSLQAAELGLTITYRCPKAVVALAAAIVPDYKAAPTAPEGVIEDIRSDGFDAQLQVGNAVLSRANAPLMPVALGLLRRGTPARIEGKDLGKALLDIVEKLRAQTVPQFLTKIEAWGERQIARFNKTKHFEEKAAQITDQVATLQAIAEGVSSVREIQSRIIQLFQDTDANSRPAVVLSTVHKAKGLEWEKVFLLVNTFNRRSPANAPKQSEAAKAAQAKEESNIYYVAITRAKQHLVRVVGEVRR